MIKFSHSIFALPFAIASFLLACRGAVAWQTLLWIVVCMVSARSAAMGFNRLADRHFDRLNPRTAERPLASGQLSVRFVVVFVVLCMLVFVLSAGMLNRLCLWLSPLALFFVLGYSLTKRFTHWCHLWLGLSLGISPLASWIAVTGEMDRSLVVPGLMAAAVFFWVSGFDLIYSCMDQQFDRAQGLHSFPSRYGTKAALRLAAVFHGVTFVSLGALAPLADLGALYLIGLGIVGLLLLIEHRLAQPERGQLDIAFFHVNSWIGIVIFLGITLDLYRGIQ